MKFPEVEAQNFEGYHVERTTSALRIRIEYQPSLYEHFMRPYGKDRLFIRSRKEERTGVTWEGDTLTVRDLPNLDPYAIRDAFESIETPEEALRFFGESGPFWGWRTILWNQFQDWQQFFKWLRLPPDVAQKSPEGRRARDSASLYGDNPFFAMSDAKFTRSRIPLDERKQMGAKRLREIEWADHLELQQLRNLAFDLRDRKIMDISWYNASNPGPPDAPWRTMPTKQSNIEPYLSIRPKYVLEAIAATIYVDRLHGLKHQKCKHCRKVFQIESDHGAQFCPPPRHLKSSPCKNAYFQKQRRGRLKAKQS